MYGLHMSLRPKDRFEIFKRDAFVCQYCGRKPPTVVLNVDHVIAKANGGSDDMGNLITSCQECNLGKSDTPIEITIAPLKLDTSDRAEKLEQLKAYQEFIVEEYKANSEWVESAEKLWSELNKNGMYPVMLSRSVNRLLKELPISEILDAIHITFENLSYGDVQDKVRYFHGVCKRKKQRLQEGKATLPCT